jgi:hypothetical protein
MIGTGEYISRADAIEAMYKDAEAHPNHSFWVSQFEALMDIHAADVRPVVRGRWEDVEVTYVAGKTTLPFERISSMRCNQCNRYHTEIYYYGDPTEMAHFCPNCGADMREGS